MAIDIDVNKFISQMWIGFAGMLIVMVTLSLIEVRCGYRHQRLLGRSLLVLSAVSLWVWVGLGLRGGEVFLPLAVVLAVGGLYWLNADRRARTSDSS